MSVTRRVFDQATLLIEGLKTVDNSRLPEDARLEEVQKTLDKALELDAKRIDAYKAWRTAVDEAADARQVLYKAIIKTKGAVRGVFGADSLQYQSIGGKRTSERKRPGPKTTKSPSN